MNKKTVLMHKTTDKCRSPYLEEMFTFEDQVYDLRDSHNKLNVPRPRAEYLERSLSYSGASLCNSLPGSLRSMSNLNAFKKTLKR